MEGTSRPVPSLCILPEDHRGLGGVQRVPACTQYVPTPLVFEGFTGLLRQALAPTLLLITGYVARKLVRIEPNAVRDGGPRRQE